MLVLTRKAGEQVIINGNIRISVVSVGPGRVKIGIEAPSDVKIDREEIHAKKQDEPLSVPAMTPAPITPKKSMPAAPTGREVETAPGVVHNRIASKLSPIAAARGYRRKAR